MDYDLCQAVCRDALPCTSRWRANVDGLQLCGTHAWLYRELLETRGEAEAADRIHYGAPKETFRP